MFLSFADRDREGFVQSANTDGVIIFIRGIGFVALDKGGRMKKSKAPAKKKSTKLGTINKPPKSKKKGKK